MVRKKNNAPEVHKFYYYKPGQNAENTKANRSIGLLIPNSTYDRYVNYAMENERVALLAEREAKRLAGIREAPFDISKSWIDNTQNIQKRRQDELLSIQNQADLDKQKIIKEISEKKILEQTEVVQQAKELLFHRRPHIRLINRARIISDCIKELDEQVKTRALEREISKNSDKENDQLILEDVKKFQQEEQKKRENINQMRQNHKAYILKQIKQNEINLKKITESTKLTEIEELKNMRKELHEIEEKELHKELQKKEKLKKMFLEAIEDRKEYTLKVQDGEKFQEQNLKTYKDLKWNIDKLVKKKKKNAKLEEIHKLEMLARKIGRSNEKSYLANEEKDRKRIEAYEEQKRMEDLKLIEDKKQKRIKAYHDMKEQIKNVTDKQEKKIKEEMDLKLWETLQRYKRDEFNKEYDLQQKQAEREKRLYYGRALKRQMAERSAEKKKAAEENDYSIEMNEMTNKANEKILSYGKKVLEESQGVRPLYPITKTIEAFKREIGLIAPFNRETDTEAPLRNIKRKGNRRIICTRPIKEEDAFYIL